MKRSLQLQLGLASLLSAGACMARFMNLSLIEAANYSDIVVDAAVESRRPSDTVSKYFGRAEILHLHVVETIKAARDTPVGDEIDVIWFPDSDDFGRPQIGNRGVMFLAKCGKFYEPIFGFEGVEPVIAGGRVQTGNLISERPAQSLRRFKQKIRRAISLPTLRHVPDSFRCASLSGQNGDEGN